MTIQDLEPVDCLMLSVDPYREAYENILWVWDLSDLVTPEELQQLADRLTRLTNEIVRVASEPVPPWDDQIPVVDFALGSGLGFRRSAYEDAVGAIQRIRDLARFVTAEELEHVAFRLGQVTNDIVMVAGRTRPRQRRDRRSRILAIMQLWSGRRQCLTA